MSEKNNQAGQPLTNSQGGQSHDFHPQLTSNQNYGFQPPPAYDQSFPAQGQQHQQFYHSQQGPQVITGLLKFS